MSAGSLSEARRARPAAGTGAQSDPTSAPALSSAGHETAEMHKKQSVKTTRKIARYAKCIRKGRVREINEQDCSQTACLH